ncbi:MAG TPA: S9 family peptidase [Thermoanaerobaculia bacterium]|nr:S9 family peptidase [Thermoanaerobaculia bacterium]
MIRTRLVPPFVAWICLGLSLLVLSPLPAAAETAAATLRPPTARKDPHVTRIHGDTLVDDYYWLRNKGTPEVESYLKAELAYAQESMKPTAALQQKLYDEMLSRIQQTDTDVPYREGGFLYYARTQEGKQYPIFCRKKGSLEAPEEVILDVNQLAEGKSFMSVAGRLVSPDGNLLAYETDDTGFRQFTLHVKDLRTGQLGPEAIPLVTSFAWAEDGKTLLYGVEHPQTKRSYRIYRHVLGEPTDTLLYEEKDERFEVRVNKSRDRQMLFIVSGSHTTSEVRYLPADHPAAEMKLIAPREQDHEYDVDHRPGEFWIRTNDKGRNFRLVAADEKDPSRAHWREIVPQRDDVMLEDVDLFQSFYVLLEQEAGILYLRVAEIPSCKSHRIEFPEPAYLTVPRENREWNAKLYRFAYQSPAAAPSIYDYDPATRERKLLKQDAILGGYDPSRYRVELIQATAPDGVRVPMWLLYRKDLKLDGTNPALLYGYGSYGAPMAATFNSNVFSLVDRGVVYAMAYVRGGGELGKKWHDNGRMMKKRNTFTDFIAAAEQLIAAKYTNKDRLAIMGGSAGGLLMGAVTNMRPDLFKVVIAQVPFVDVINTMLDESLPLTSGEFEEWGNPKIEAEYRYMKSYSPYDNIEAKAYPTMLVKSSYNDSQVMYWEPAKYVAKLRALKTDGNPLLFNINMEPAGHGGKSGRYNRLRDSAFDYAFLLWQLGVEKVQ